MSVVSWDCFDTLVGRKLKKPKSVFDEIAKITGDDSFTENRIQAERKSTKKTLEDIYSLLPEHDLDLELQIEKLFSFPILENFNQVKDGDIIVSDMYLSKDQIRALLDHHGFNKDVEIYVTYGGKARGYVWDNILSKHKLSQHIGDNINADVISPRNKGISSLYYGGAGWTPYEAELEQYDYVYASMARFMRLSNPYSFSHAKLLHDFGSFQNIGGLFWCEETGGKINNFFLQNNDQQTIKLKKIYKKATVYLSKTKSEASVTFHQDGHTNIKSLYLTNPYWFDVNLKKSYGSKVLWDEQAIFNIPILLNFIYALPKHQPIVFLYRDCVFLKRLYEALCPDNACYSLNVSRKAYDQPYNEDFIKYVLQTAKHRTLVDLHGSGQSTKKFFDRYNQSFELLFLCKHRPSWSEFQSYNKHLLICNSRHQGYKNISGSTKKRPTCRGTMLEKLNLPDNMGELIDWQNGIPIRLSPSEHDPNITSLYNEAINFIIREIPFFKDRIVYNQNIVDLLLTIAVKEETLTDNLVNSLWDNNKHPASADFFNV